MTDELNFKKNRLAELSAGNDRSYSELMAATGGAARMDTTSARLELLIETLVAAGVLTEEQVLDFEIKFHEKVEDALNQHWSQVRQMQAEARAPKLVVPGGGRKSTLTDAHGRPLKS